MEPYKNVHYRADQITSWIVAHGTMYGGDKPPSKSAKHPEKRRVAKRPGTSQRIARLKSNPGKSRMRAVIQKIKALTAGIKRRRTRLRQRRAQPNRLPKSAARKPRRSATYTHSLELLFGSSDPTRILDSNSAGSRAVGALLRYKVQQEQALYRQELRRARQQQPADHSQLVLDTNVARRLFEGGRAEWEIKSILRHSDGFRAVKDLKRSEYGEHVLTQMRSALHVKDLGQNFRQQQAQQKTQALSQAPGNASDPDVKRTDRSRYLKEHRVVREVCSIGSTEYERIDTLVAYSLSLQGYSEKEIEKTLKHLILPKHQRSQMGKDAHIASVMRQADLLSQQGRRIDNEKDHQLYEIDRKKIQAYVQSLHLQQGRGIDFER